MNPSWRVEVMHLGAERQPLLLLDDFVADPQALVEDACRRDYAVHGAYYPGVRAAVPAETSVQLRSWL